MTDVNDLRSTIVPKSDQLNADDLIGRSITVTVTAVKAGESPDQPVSVHIDGGYKPYKPCKSMRRVLILIWGDNGNAWVGRRLTMYCDPEVKFGGVKVGGIRISHMSDLEADVITISMTVTKAKRVPYTVRKLAPEIVERALPFAPALFAEKLPIMRKAIADGKLTVDQAIKRAELTGTLSDEQKAAIRAPDAPTPSLDAPAPEAVAPFPNQATDTPTPTDDDEKF